MLDLEAESEETFNDAGFPETPHLFNTSNLLVSSTEVDSEDAIDGAGFLEDLKYDSDEVSTAKLLACSDDTWCTLYSLGGDFGSDSCSTSATCTDFDSVPLHNIAVRHTFVQYSTDVVAARLSQSETLSHFCSKVAALSSCREDHVEPIPVPPLPSRGSALHACGECKPCGFLYNDKKGCTEGHNCRFCHLCGPDERKKRREAKAKRMRLLRFAESAV